MEDIKIQINRFINTVRLDNKILAVFLFGSRARKDNFKESDIDICLIMKQGFYSSIELSEKKLEYNSLFNMDVQVFQQLPVYIKIRIIKEGGKIFCVNEDELYQIVFRTIREFDDFKDFYYDYLKGVANAG